MPQTTAHPGQLAPYTAAHKRGPLVVAVGGSDQSSALRAAERLAGSSNTAVLAVSVVEPLPVYLGGEALGTYHPDTYEDQRKLGALERLTHQIAETVGRHSEWELRVRAGDPAHVLAQTAMERNAPLIVMGLGRHRRIDQFLGLETTLRTIHRARCPVLAVPPNYALATRVLIATDFSPASARAAEAALPLMDSAASVTVLHVWQPSLLAEIDGRAQEQDTRYPTSLARKFERFINLLQLPASATVACESRTGDVAEEVLTHARSMKADLIVGGRRGLGSLQRVLTRSVTSALVRGAHCAVFIAPEPGYADIDRLRLGLTGTSTSAHPHEWKVQLAGLTERNAGRLAAIEVDDPDLGAQLQSSGYHFVGAAYDPHDSRVELMLGEPGAVHFTRNISGVTALTVVADDHGRDIGLKIAHGDGQTLLTFSKGTAPLVITSNASRRS